MARLAHNQKVISSNLTAATKSSEVYSMAHAVHVAIPDGHLDKLRQIKRRLANLSPDWSNPQRYFSRRDELVDELDQLERGRG